ncbi:ABC transporter substrate-binding protein [Streptomyces sp. DASNCL29]|uniref:nSTAND3 domain-containing NTPase n=1 Tax=Streptomyces sp. DASNCL29 TaxID=2583819 RepID=UPI00110FC0FB|nr:ABC transporter substrate-binding protein [Streptomyces sp. DASNCL29]TMU89931.1 ABC transporter substrate-binding protein [Streptomyces sp. DASNCL29]
MRETNSTYVRESHGNMHGGGGNQYNIYTYLQAASGRLGGRGKDPRAFAQDQLADLYRRFVAPKGFGQAQTLLLRHGTVLLSGPPGSGRRTAALMLLRHLADDANDVHELDIEDEPPVLNIGAVGEGNHLLLDLSEVDEVRYDAVQSELSGFRSDVQRRGARLAIVLPHATEQRRSTEFLPLTADIERPLARDLLMRHLRVDHIHPALADLASPDLAHYMASAGAGALARLADLIRRARDEGKPSDTFADWSRNALAALTNLGDDVAKFVASLKDGRQRALLLSVAMFHESTPDTVFRGATSLLDEVGHPEHEEPRLSRTDLARQLEEVGAKADSDGLVRFQAWSYDLAVRNHFWTYYPDLRDRFRQWVRNCAAWLTPKTRNALIARFSEQALRTDRPDDLWGLAEQWTDPKKGMVQLLPDAIQVLAEGLRHDRHGHTFRRKIYHSSLADDLPRWRRHALISVCAEVMAVRHPDQALVRLHHLARRAQDTDTDRARTELLVLAQRDTRLSRLLLERIDLEHHPADAEIFLALAESAARTRALYISMSVRNLLTRGWAAVLRTCPRPTWKEPVEGWLHAAKATATHGDALLDVLVDACEQRSDAYNGLYVISRNWAAASSTERSRRDALAQHFAQKIDAAQGIAMEEATA